VLSRALLEISIKPSMAAETTKNIVIETIISINENPPSPALT
jgi:hypothetical protein